jgi:alanyl-tRNA synthetase
MTTNEIRVKFLEFFASKGHTVVESDSVVPKDDPTVLFTTAGMQQFKRQFLGYIDGYTRASSSQKCLRTDDLDKVGKTDFHHTFFEMLGNFSFGDYFKKEAVVWAWEFLTQWMKIPPEKLWVSVYKDDEEAAQIWLKDIKIHPDKLVRLGDHSNFWPADAKEKGPNGPCGPCSEIFYDYGVNAQCRSKTCDPACDCGRFSEIWNLVFTQFNRREGGVLEPLPNKNIDTGMGLERLAAVVQGKRNNFETDIFAPIMKAIDRVTGSAGECLTLTQKRVIADHIRAIVFAINDGVIPSNKERGFVIKGLINSSANIALSLGSEKPTIYKLVPAVVEVMQSAYPDLQKKAKEISGLIKQTEETFIEVRKQRIPELKTKIRQCCEQLITHQVYDQRRIMRDLGEMFFLYHDTYGLPLETILTTVRQEIGDGHEAEMKGALDIYDEKMRAQRERSRIASKMTGDVFTDTEAVFDVPRTEFLGYDHDKSRSAILRLFINNLKVNEASKGDPVKVVLDKTPFYAEAGGQTGDTGYIRGQNGKIRVEDTRKVNEIYVHSGIVEDGLIRAGDSVEADIDGARRLAIMRHHTATHLLQAALREVLGAHIQQQGSMVSEDRLRFDFTHPKALSKDELDKIEQRVNEYVLQCDRVTKESLSLQDARGSGALAFFAEKYGDVVRVVSAGDYSKEFCGGTHLDFTGQIGLLKIVSEYAIAQGIRRLEAKAGTQALQWIRDREDQMDAAARILKTSPQDLVARVDAQAKRLREAEKDLEKYRFEVLKSEIDIMIANAETLNGVKVICHAFLNADMALLRRVSDLIKQKSKSSVVVLGAETLDASSLLIAVTDDLVGKGIKADEMIQEVAPVIGGSGGGRPHLAQAGGRETGKMGQAMQKAHQLIKGKIRK